MTPENSDWLSPGFWLRLMGRELERAPLYAAQPVLVEDGKFKLHGGHVRYRVEPGKRVAFRLDGGSVLLAEAPGGIEVEESSDETYEFALPDDVREALGRDEPLHAMVIATNEGLELVPIRVEERASDVLGPRVIDELREPGGGRTTRRIVRHVVKGFELEELSAERLRELEDLVCAEPFGHDAVAPLAEGDDWVGWKTRREVLEAPSQGDDALGESLAARVFEGQQANGSWDSSPVKTAYGILRALSLEVPKDDARLARAAGWLLDLTEPVGRPGMWMHDAKALSEWDGLKSGKVRTDREDYFDLEALTDADHDMYRCQESQEVIPTCCRNYAAVCYSRMLHPAATVAEALCRTGHGDHPRVRDFASTLLQVGGEFGYFCSCWGIVSFGREVERTNGREPDFERWAESRKIALRSLPYGYARDAEDVLALAYDPNYAGVHRPDLADTNGSVPYTWRKIGSPGRYALVGSYWQNADCWAKSNRGLSQLPGWPGSAAAFLALFQCHLYQTPLGAWDQGFPGGLFRWAAEVTRLERTQLGVDGSAALRFAKTMLLKTVPWLRANQKPDGLWAHDELPHWGMGDLNRAPGRRLGSYHIVSVLKEFGLLDRLRARG